MAKIGFQNGEIYAKLDFKKAKFVKNRISKRGFWFKKAKFAEKLNLKDEIC